MGIFTHILLAYDGSPGSERALTRAARLAGEQGAALTILSAVEGCPDLPVP